MPTVELLVADAGEPGLRDVTLRVDGLTVFRGLLTLQAVQLLVVAVPRAVVRPGREVLRGA